MNVLNHDLRNPLTSIIGYVQLLKSYSGCNDENFSEYIKVTYRRLKGLSDHKEDSPAAQRGYIRKG